MHELCGIRCHSLSLAPEQQHGQVGNIGYSVKMGCDAAPQQSQDGSFFMMNKMISVFIFFRCSNTTKSCHSRLSRKITVSEIQSPKKIIIIIAGEIFIPSPINP